MNISPTRPRRGLNVSLWLVQVILVAAFGMAGIMKTFQPYEALVESMVWPGALPVWLVRVIGMSELLGSLGLLLPSLLRVKPVLTPIAACGIVTIMVLASAFHVSRGEFPYIVFNLILGLLASFVAWGRWKRLPIVPRSARSTGDLQ